MYRWCLICLLALTTVTIAAEKRKIHRLAGGHLRIVNTNPDDAEFLQIEASGSREKKQKTAPDEKKTLSQQVADGKYGLIQNELFSRPPKRPGVLSYDDNPEVPKDTKDNLGGLKKNEIWLAENHLLVLKGGTYPPHDERQDGSTTLWPPIDNYKAPLHQVKIPKHPKVPPPFPVQFTDDGPLQIIGTNTTTTLNDSVEPQGYALPPPDGYIPEAGPFVPPNYPYPANAPPGQAPLPIPINPSGDYPQGVPPPFFPLNDTLPPYFASLPPGAAILPPPGNQSDIYDDDDPSIYYPPPYSFFYPKDNSSAVPPGPLVPGIILPPPPNFFAPLQEETTTTKQPQRQRKPTTILIPVTEKTTTTTTPFKVYPVDDSHYNVDIKSKIITTAPPRVFTTVPNPQQNKNYTVARTKPTQAQRKRPQVTILRPVKPNTPSTLHENEISDKPFASYGLPKSRITTTHVPLKYYTTANNIEADTATKIPEKVQIIKTTIKPVQLYFYEEQPDRTTQRTPLRQSYIDISNDYYLPPKPTTLPRQRKPQYVYVDARPYNTQKPKFQYVQQPAKSDSFSIHIARLQNQIHQYYTTPRTTNRPVYSSKPIYQFSFEAANYRPRQNNFKPSQPDLNQEDQFRPLPKYSVQIQQAIEIIPTQPASYQQNPSPAFYQHYQKNTERPRNYYTTSNYAFENDITQRNVVTPRPIAEYSFEVTPNPIYQGFYTKPDEGYFDDNTKKYFTIFGKKLPSATTPLPNIAQTTPISNLAYNRPNQQSNNYQKPISLEEDTLVNYVNPRPTINPDAELISPPQRPSSYPNVRTYPAPQRNQNAEIIKAVPVEVPEDQDGSFISYQLPGDDGAHFYFLTPQLAQRRDQNADYFYMQSNSNRRRRNEKNKGR